MLDSKSLVGKTKQEAIDTLSANGKNYRIKREDGVNLLYTMQLWIGCWLTVDNGIVTEVEEEEYIPPAYGG